MKKILIIFIVVVIGLSTKSFAQIQNIVCTDDSSLVIDNIYAGILSSVNFNVKEIGTTSSYDLRVGAMATWSPTKWADIKTQTTYGKNREGELIVNQFSLHLHKNAWDIEFGKMATSATEIRPLPATANGHFETWTEAQMPGATIGAKIGYKSDFGAIKIGIAFRKQNPDYSFHLSTNVKNNIFHLVGVLGGEKKDEFLIGLTHKINRLYQVVVFKQKLNLETLSAEQVAGYFGDYEVSKKMKLNIYLDAGYNLESKESPRLEAGVIKNFECKIFKGVIAIGYANENEAIKAYLFVHL